MSALSQLPLVQNNSHANIEYFGMEYLDPFQQFKEKELEHKEVDTHKISRKTEDQAVTGDKQ